MPLWVTQLDPASFGLLIQRSGSVGLSSGLLSPLTPLSPRNTTSSSGAVPVTFALGQHVSAGHRACSPLKPSLTVQTNRVVVYSFKI